MAALRLRPIELADLPTLHRWSQDPTFCQRAEWTPGLSLEQLSAFWTRLLTTPDERFLRLGVEWEGELVGYADLAALDRVEGTAELGLCISPSTNWGRGFGEAAGRLMLLHGFQTLGLRRIWAEVHAPNTASLSLMHKLGFVQEGVLRQHGRYQDEVVDLLRFGMLRTEFGSQ